MRVVRAAQCRRMPWKNGGGETTEIATCPEGAGLDGFVWRLSAARVAGDGPFSRFPGVDRTLAVLSGAGLELTLGRRVHRLGWGDAPLPFPGDDPTMARLLDGAIEDLNIMTRRDAVRHCMRRVEVDGSWRSDTRGETLLLFCAEGRLTADAVTLEPRDTLVLDREAAPHLCVAGQGTLYLVEIWSVARTDPPDRSAA